VRRDEFTLANASDASFPKIIHEDNAKKFLGGDI